MPPWQPNEEPVLRFTPNAWAKLIYLRDLGPTEIGGFGITMPHDPLIVMAFCLVKQTCTSVSVLFDDASVADFFDAQHDARRYPDQYGKVWIHTHPGASAKPSRVDEETFRRVFHASDWSVMCIISATGRRYARLNVSRSLGRSIRLNVEVDFSCPFAGADFKAWREEYEQCVTVAPEAGLLFDNHGWRNRTRGSRCYRPPKDNDLFGMSNGLS